MTSESEPRGEIAPGNLCLLHGVGGPPEHQGWLKALNERLALLGEHLVAPGDAEVIDYSPALKTKSSGDVEFVPVVVPQLHTEWEKQHYQRRAEQLRAVASPLRDRRPTIEPGDLHPVIRRGLARTLRETSHFREAERYRKYRSVRAGVLELVLQKLPTQPFVLIAHSLGSHVAADLLRYLPYPSPLSCLVTIGTPLSGTGIMQRTVAELDPFPYGKLGCWVNVYSRWDFVTSGKPLGRRIPAVVDIPIDPPLRRIRIGPRGIRVPHHGRSAYLGHPATAAIIAQALDWTSHPDPENSMEDGGVSDG